jgi:chaperonin GroES
MEAKTASGIYLPESSVKELNEAKVLAVGPGGLDKDGKRVQCSVKPGDKVLIPQVGGLEYSQLGGESMMRRQWDWK